jgi:tetratricopeptide (TPR) repeat protein
MAKVSLRAYNREIETMIDRGQLDEAIANCHHIFKTYPKHLETYRLLGKAYLEYKRFKEAVDVFSRVLVSEPNDFVANVGMSIIRDDENKLDDAIWHMERAFETQPSNAAIQGELQRLYGRRDGVQPPRIRMTRGALAHMYVQGELYPQAISEIKSVLKEDPGRSDMEALLARACYRSGLKNEAADAASKVLRRYPYCLDANRVLMEIFGADHPENAQIYRQRVIELDPYAAQVTGSVFQSNEVQDAAVSLEHLDWNGQPSAPQADWSANQAIGLESGEQPDWLKNAYADTTPPTTPSLTRPVDQTQGGLAPVSAATSGEEEIPDFLRAAGWGQSTGAFDESKSIFGDEQSSGVAAQPIEQGEMPDWVKAMAPTEVTETPAEEEELPDWINKIGTGALPVPSASQSENDLDWMSQLGQTSEPAAPAQSADNDLDWLSQLGQPAQPAPSAGPESVTPAADDPLAWTQQINESTTSEPLSVSDDLPDWLNPPGTPAQPASMERSFEEQFAQPTPVEPAAEDPLDWMKQLDQPSAVPSSDLPDWMAPPDQPEESTQPEAMAQSADAEPDWMKPLDQPQASTSTDLPDWMTKSELPSAVEQSVDAEPDWMKQSDQPTASAADLPDWMTQPEQPAATPQLADDQPDWMRPLDLPEDLPLSLEGRSEEQASAPISSDFDFLNQFKEESPQEIPTTSAPTVPASMQDTGNLGVSEQERDDSFAWLENLAAKQGASEGLLTKPEDRLQEEPEWVKQAKGLSVDRPAVEQTLSAEVEPEIPSPAESTPVAFESPVIQEPSVETPPLMQQPASSIEELGKSEQERDDSFAWLENLAAKQGASEGLLTKPEDRLEQEPEWVRQAKDLNVAGGEAPVPSVETPVEPPVTTSVESIEEVAPPVIEETAAVNREELGKSEQERDDSFAWLENLAAKQGASEGLLTKPEDRLEQEPEWVKQAKDLSVSAPPTPPAQEVSAPEPAALDDTAAWLRSLDDEDSKAAPVTESSKDDTAIWFKNLSKEETEPAPIAESSKDDTAMWLKNLAEEESKPAAADEPSRDDTQMWLQNLAEEESKPPTSAEPAIDETAMWLKSLDEAEKPTPRPEAFEQPDLPAWMQDIDEGTPQVEESTIPEKDAKDTSIWPASLDEPTPSLSGQDAPKRETGSLPSWLRGLEKSESQAQESASAQHDDLPAWLRDETGEVVAEPTRIEPTRATDWQPAQPVETSQPEPSATEPASVSDWQAEEEKQSVEPQAVAQEPEPAAPVEIIEEKPASVEEPELTPAAPSPPYKEPVTRRGTGMLTMPLDPLLGSARNELSRSNIPGALDTYAKLIKKGRFLDEVVHDLREALYRYPVEVNIWQSLGDAYMRSNRLQDALDAYTKAEELLR